MIRETIITSCSPTGTPHIAPMGVHVLDGELLIMPFRPSTTLDNVLATRVAIVNYTNDVRVFAGCLTGRRDWPLCPADHVPGQRLAQTLAHAELELLRWEEDELRPRLYCRVVHEVNHAPFRGFNRAQYSVLEAAILVSRLHMLPWDKIESELAYLRIGLEKTAGPAELEAWGWLMEAVEAFKRTRPNKAVSI
ncbi:DUF447 domain-containing protein [Methylocaldum szegediense]|jgi:hypothetical protein|uniref:Tetrahydromethanopterin synthesis protein n=1 Tax=Methylocaldum szegediense TaxID=73780 RepID=A0ABM9I4R4_9GAMM|nr:DUF447 domain-containing protein [Methylocaldum szegediense]CAI8891792.1 conserved protein of unknown function [Methylocaldum szegediense]